VCSDSINFALIVDILSESLLQKKYKVKQFLIKFIKLKHQ